MNDLDATSALGDIVTPRLELRVMGPRVVDACLAGDLVEAGRLLGVAVPAELLEQPAGLVYGKAQLDADPDYLPWSGRAMILAGSGAMVGHVRFHSRPDPEDLRRYARDAVELAYTVFEAHRRHGYASEAVGAAMDWAQDNFGIRRFVASVSPRNVASLGLVARLGFSRVGEQIDEVDGIEHVFMREQAERG